MAKRSGWKILSGDVNWLDYGATWYRHAGGTRYHVAEIINMDEACGRDNDGHDTYNVCLSEVDSASEQLASAIESCGWEGMDAASDIAKVEALHSYGAKAPLGQWDGNNAHKLLRAAKRESTMLLSDAAAYHVRMHETPVNRIGATATEYAAGDVASAIGRGLAAGDPNAELMLKLYGGKV